MKQYQYDPKRYLVQVTITGIFCALLGVVSVIAIAVGFMVPVMMVVSVVCSYTVLNSFIARSTPERVEITKHQISFEAYGKKTTYPIKSLKSFRIREFPTSGKMYIRINDYSLLKGRFWIQTKMFNDGSALFRQLLDLEYELHPDSLKARARRVNTEYNEKAALKNS